MEQVERSNKGRSHFEGALQVCADLLTAATGRWTACTTSSRFEGGTFVLAGIIIAT